MGGRVKAWVEALRLRTLPLSLSGVVVASGMAGFYGVFSWGACANMLAMAALLQILSNFADEYGDLAHGADNDDRIGPVRGLQRGDITAGQMRVGIVVAAAGAVALAIVLLLGCLGPELWAWRVFFLVLMAACVGAAVLYTMGPRPYGYHGLGDLFCFAFFGIVPVIGGFFLFAAHAGHVAWVPATALPAIAIGALSTGTLNLNNMRDIATDQAAGKRTLAVLLGPAGARAYHLLLAALGLAGFLAFSLVVGATRPLQFVYLVAYLPYVRLVIRMLQVREPAGYDALMRPWSMSAALLSLLFALCMALG